MSLTWVVAADASRARIFSADKTSDSLLELRTLSHPEARLHEGDLVSDRSGRDRNSASGSHGIGDGTGQKGESVDRFAAMVSETLEGARKAGECRKLYLVAAPAFLGKLRKYQSNAMRELVAGEIDKNLSQNDPAEIRKHLPKIL